MRIFKNKFFHHWAEKIGISNDQLKQAIKEIGQDAYEANLGGNIFKKRIAVEGRGKSSGIRTIVAFKSDKNSFFIYAYAKNVRANISEKEEIALKKLAKLYFSFSDAEIIQAVKSGTLFEVK